MIRVASVGFVQSVGQRKYVIAVGQSGAKSEMLAHRRSGWGCRPLPGGDARGLGVGGRKNPGIPLATNLFLCPAFEPPVARNGTGRRG